MSHDPVSLQIRTRISISQAGDNLVPRVRVTLDHPSGNENAKNKIKDGGGGCHLGLLDVTFAIAIVILRSFQLVVSFFSALIPDYCKNNYYAKTATILIITATTTCLKG